MTYEERIATAQAKMQNFKEKMAATAEKTKAARALKKEEISAAIAEINADLDELNEAIADELNGGIVESINETIEDIDAEVEGQLNAADENSRLAEERRESKAYAMKLKAQMKAEALKEKLAQKREAEDKEAMEEYILDLLDYAECCQQIAFAAAVEADLALLEAANAAAEYNEKYGEPESAEAPETEAE